MDPDERGHFLEQPPEGGPDIDKAHEVVAPICYSVIGLANMICDSCCLALALALAACPVYYTYSSICP